MASEKGDSAANGNGNSNNNKNGNNNSNGNAHPNGGAAAAAGPKKKIAIMTSGGDSAGMNGVVRACVRMAIHDNCDAYCVYEGYEGLVRGGTYIRKMDWYDVRGWLSEGGTLIGTRRCMAFYERPGRLQAAKNMVLEGIDALIICGGDGSLTGADRFRQEWPGLLAELVATGQLTQDQVAPHQHLNIVGLVGSIDNDLTGTDATIGAYSSLARICDAVDLIDSTAQSHSRAFVIEVMGRHCGWLALMAGVATGADFIFIPEKPRKDNWREEMCNVVHHHRMIGKRKTIVIIAEGALDRHGTKITSDMVKDLLADKDGLGLDTRVTVLGHLQRGGSAVAYDRMLATLQGAEAVRAVLEATPESPTYFIAINENQIVRKPLMEAVQATKEVAKAIESQQFDYAMSLRDRDFAEHYKSFMMTTAVQMDANKIVAAEKRMKIAIINVGAPAGGMNAAMRGVVAYCLSRGHEPIAIHNGFAGFLRHHEDQPLGSVRKFDWLEVDGWASRGGSEIGTNREVPGENIEKVAELFTKYGFNAILLIGGFEAFAAASQLRKGRDLHPALRIPIVLLPATVSNNVPGTEYSLGSDTALNELVNYCDKIKQSASATRRRVFVIETQGGRCGYLATLAGLSVGAIAVYTPEEGIKLKKLLTDVEHLKHVFKKDTGQSRAGRLVLINEKASEVYNAKLIADILRDESGGRFESREGVPGHLQQGGIPSAMDRCRAVRLAIMCCQQIEKYTDMTPDEIKQDQLSACVIGIEGAQIIFRSIEELEDPNLTDWPNRRPVRHHWLEVKRVLNILGGKARNRFEKDEEDEAPLTGTLAKDVKRGLTNA